MTFPKPATLRDPRWLIELRAHPCIITGIYGNDVVSVVPAHIGTRGKGLKSPDNECLPMSAFLHNEAHATGEMTFFRENLPDDVLRDALRAYAREYYAKHKPKWTDK